MLTGGIRRGQHTSSPPCLKDHGLLKRFCPKQTFAPWDKTKLFKTCLKRLVRVLPNYVGTDAKGSVFVNLVQKNVVLQIDAPKMTVAHTWPVAPGVGPRTMAVDQNSGRLFIGCANRRMVILDSNNGRVIGSVPIGTGPDDSAYDPETHLVYTSNGDGSVSVIQQESSDNYRVLEMVKTAPGARNMALDLKTKKIFLPLSDGEAPPPGTQTRGKVIPGSFRVLVFGM